MTASVGLECPTCGCRDLRPAGNIRGAACIIRVRICRHCGKRISKRETAKTTKEHPCQPYPKN